MDVFGRHTAGDRIAIRPCPTPPHDLPITVFHGDSLRVLRSDAGSGRFMSWATSGSLSSKPRRHPVSSGLLGLAFFAGLGGDHSTQYYCTAVETLRWRAHVDRCWPLVISVESQPPSVFLSYARCQLTVRTSTNRHFVILFLSPPSPLLSSHHRLRRTMENSMENRGYQSPYCPAQSDGPSPRSAEMNAK